MRSIAAVLVGFVVLSLLLYTAQGAGDAVMFRMHPELPATTSVITLSTLSRVLWLIWETASMVVAGFVTARIAPAYRAQHATLMGGIQAVFTIGAMFSIQDVDPLWFWIVGIALMVPAAWLGGKLA